MRDSEKKDDSSRAAPDADARLALFEQRLEMVAREMIGLAASYGQMSQRMDRLAQNSDRLVGIADMMKQYVNAARRVNQFDWEAMFRAVQELVNHDAVLTRRLVHLQADLRGVAAPSDDEIFPDDP